MRGGTTRRSSARLSAAALLAALLAASCVATAPGGGGSSDGRPAGTGPTTSGSPTSGANPAGPAASWSPPPVPTSVAGHAVLTVSQAIAQRDAGTLGERSIAVGGYWSVRVFPLSCPYPGASPGELEMYCNGDQAGITEQYEAIAIVTRDVHSMGFSATQHPHLNPYVPASLRDELFGGYLSSDPDFPPVPIVVLGHFDDSRAKQCQPEAAQVCRERFVLESVLLFDPVHAPSATASPAPTPFPSPAPSALFAAEAC